MAIYDPSNSSFDHVGDAEKGRREKHAITTKSLPAYSDAGVIADAIQSTCSTSREEVLSKHLAEQSRMQSEVKQRFHMKAPILAKAIDVIEEVTGGKIDVRSIVPAHPPSTSDFIKGFFLGTRWGTLNDFSDFIHFYGDRQPYAPEAIVKVQYHGPNAVRGESDGIEYLDGNKIVSRRGQSGCIDHISLYQRFGADMISAFGAIYPNTRAGQVAVVKDMFGILGPEQLNVLEPTEIEGCLRRLKDFPPGKGGAECAQPTSTSSRSELQESNFNLVGEFSSSKYATKNAGPSRHAVYGQGFGRNFHL